MPSNSRHHEPHTSQAYNTVRHVPTGGSPTRLSRCRQVWPGLRAQKEAEQQHPPTNTPQSNVPQLFYTSLRLHEMRTALLQSNPGMTRADYQLRSASQALIAPGCQADFAASCPPQIGASGLSMLQGNWGALSTCYSPATAFCTNLAHLSTNCSHSNNGAAPMIEQAPVH